MCMNKMPPSCEGKHENKLWDLEFSKKKRMGWVCFLKAHQMCGYEFSKNPRWLGESQLKLEFHFWAALLRALRPIWAYLGHTAVVLVVAIIVSRRGPPPPKKKKKQYVSVVVRPQRWNLPHNPFTVEYRYLHPHNSNVVNYLETRKRNWERNVSKNKRTGNFKGNGWKNT